MLSDLIVLACGVRQGGALSAILFAVYVNDVIEKLSRSNFFMSYRGLFWGCIMYADDLI